MKLLFKNKKEDFLNRLKKQELAAQKIFYDQNVIKENPKEIVSQIFSKINLKYICFFA